MTLQAHADDVTDSTGRSIAPAQPEIADRPAGPWDANVQRQADEILARMVHVVCDGWIEPRHARRVMAEGNPENVSHGMCPECFEAMNAEMDEEAGR